MHHKLTATQALQHLEGYLTVEDYTIALLSRIEARDKLKAWAFLDRECVLTQARALDQISRDKRGPLHGVAVAVKDMICTEDMPTQFGTSIYQDYRSGVDAAAVATLRKAGALILGKTTTTEFSVANSGPQTVNPHNFDRTPGGSSCGSAAAVADQQVPLSLGTQTGGSLIRPASFNGVFAFKPTHNTISLEGTKTISTSFDTIGFFARSMEDIQLVASVFGIRNDGCLDEVPLRDCSVALIRTPMWPEAGPGTVQAMEKTVKILEAHDVKVVQVEFSAEEVGNLSKLKLMQDTVISKEAGNSLLKEYRKFETHPSQELNKIIRRGAGYTAGEKRIADEWWASMRRAVDELAADYSVIITPSAIDEAPRGKDMGSPTFNTLWTGLHMPVINVPAFVGPHGMPIGISLVARRHGDQHLLKIARILSEPLMANGGWDPDQTPHTL